MDRIDKYLNSIYINIIDSSKEKEDLKQEMRNHLMETVKELQENGITEEESVRIVIERFREEFASINFSLRNCGIFFLYCLIIICKLDIYQMNTESRGDF